MSDNIVKNYNQLRQNVIEHDRRFTSRNGKLCFEGLDVEALAKNTVPRFMCFLSLRLCAISKKSSRLFPHMPKPKRSLPQKPVR